MTRYYELYSIKRRGKSVEPMPEPFATGTLPESWTLPDEYTITASTEGSFQAIAPDYRNRSTYWQLLSVFNYENRPVGFKEPTP